jgi:DNA-binding winged helix-turn-helix (wHTH) protein
MKEDSQINIRFRENEVDQVFETIVSGNSCSIVGIGSCGKSNLLRFLMEEKVQQVKLGSDRDSFLFIYVDTNKMLKLSQWGLYELMLHQMINMLIEHNIDEGVIEAAGIFHEKIMRKPNGLLSLRYLDRAILMVCNKNALRLVFLFDEFDALISKMPASGFRALRALRDDHKYRLMYVVVTRLEIPRLRQDISEVEHFEELVTSTTIWLGPYVKEDALMMLSRLERRHGLKLSESVKEQIVEETGGHPGLIREVFNQAKWNYDISTRQELIPSIIDECRRIWFSLDKTEQDMIVRFANSISPFDETDFSFTRLLQKGIIRTNSEPGEYAIFSPLFLDYLKQQKPVIGAHIFIEEDKNKAWINGKEIKNIKGLEFRLLSLMAQNRNKTCTRDKIAEVLYPEDNNNPDVGVSNTRIDSVVKRLRKLIEPDPEGPKYIINIRSEGFQLNDPPLIKELNDGVSQEER